MTVDMRNGKSVTITLCTPFFIGFYLVMCSKISMHKDEFAFIKDLCNQCINNGNGCLSKLEVILLQYSCLL